MQDDQNNPKTPWWIPGLTLFAKLSGWIAGPVILAVIVGKWLDKKYNTAPWLFLVSVGVAFIISIVGIIHDTLKEMKRIDKETNNKKKDKEDKK